MAGSTLKGNDLESTVDAALYRAYRKSAPLLVATLEALVEIGETPEQIEQEIKRRGLGAFTASNDLRGIAEHIYRMRKGQQ